MRVRTPGVGGLLVRVTTVPDGGSAVGGQATAPAGAGAVRAVWQSPGRYAGVVPGCGVGWKTLPGLQGAPSAGSR